MSTNMNAYLAIKGINIVLGGACLGLEAHVVSETFLIDLPLFDVIFLIVVALAVLESIISLLTACCNQTLYSINSSMDNIIRGIETLALLVVGLLLIYSAIVIKDDCRIRRCLEPDFCYYSIHDCQPFEVKLVAGILCAINGVFHATGKKTLGQNVVPQQVYVYPVQYPGGAPPPTFINPTHQVPSGPTLIQQNTSYMPPPSGGHQQQNYQIPRLQVQNQFGQQYNNGNYNPTIASTPMSRDSPQQHLRY